MWKFTGRAAQFGTIYSMGEGKCYYGRWSDCECIKTDSGYAAYITGYNQSCKMFNVVAWKPIYRFSLE